MTENTLKSLPEWNQAAVCAGRMALPENHLKHLVRQPERLEEFSLRGAGLFYDFTRQRLDGGTLKVLVDLARARRVKERFEDMVSGQIVNVTEKRAALHTATRSFSKDSDCCGRQ